METKPLVSIILTCYNLEHYIGEAITSLLQQDFIRPFEIIVIDDGSSDSSVETINKIADTRLVKVFFPVNKGAVEAINYGFSIAKGNYICRFDGDDKWYPAYLKTAATVLDENPDIGIVHSDCTLINSLGEITNMRGNVNRPKELPVKCNEFRYLIKSYYMNAPTMMIRRQVWDCALPWKERFRTGMGDWYNSLLMTEKYDSYYIAEPLAYYRVHASNMHKAYLKDRTGEANAAFVLNYFYENKKEAFTEQEWRQIFSDWYKNIGMSYFVLAMTKDARRCFKKALVYNWKLISNPGFVRILFASFIGKDRYNKMKSYAGKSVLLG
jgi:glycosyltransferase involved in cell wall biosynthesis